MVYIYFGYGVMVCAKKSMVADIFHLSQIVCTDIYLRYPGPQIFVDFLREK